MRKCILPNIKKPLKAASLSSLMLLAACGEMAKQPISASIGPKPTLLTPNKTLIPTIHIAPAIGWPSKLAPTAATGTNVAAFASGLQHPRWLYLLPNGDVLVAETNAPPKPDDGKGIQGWVMGLVMKRAGAAVPSADRITLLRDVDGDGVADLRLPFIEDLHSPFGMVLVGDKFYVANSDALVRYNYIDGAKQITEPGEQVIDLPAGRINHHWTKNIIANTDGTKLYVTVGSNSNVGERGMAEEEGRAAIWEVDIATGKRRIFASGLRNPNGMVWDKTSNTLFTVVNERDQIGSDLVPDYLTSVQDGAFYGWPYSYYGQHIDERIAPQKPDLVAKAVAPDYALGAHTASLGLASSIGNSLPAQFASGMFIGQHGSWNRKPLSGYKVIFVPFDNGKPSGQPIDVLTGFISNKGEAYGRPVGVVLDKTGALLVADDVGNTIWRVTASAKTSERAIEKYRG